MPKFDTTPEELLVALCNGEYTHTTGILEDRDDKGNPVGNCCLGVYCRIAGVPFAEGDATLEFSPLDNDLVWEEHPEARLPEGHWLNSEVSRIDEDDSITRWLGLDSILIGVNDQRTDVGYDLVIQALCYFLAGQPIPYHLEPLNEVA